MCLRREIENQGILLFKHRGHLPIMLPVAIIIYGQQNADVEVKSEKSINDLFEYICFLVSFFGLTLRAYIVGFTPNNTSGRNTAGQIAYELNTTGLYSVCRHPLYLANFIMWLGVAIRTKNIALDVIFGLSFWIYYERIMFAEEAFLSRSVYLDWAEVTPAFIPDFRKWRRNRKLSFLQKDGEAGKDWPHGINVCDLSF